MSNEIDTIRRLAGLLACVRYCFVDQDGEAAPGDESIVAEFDSALAEAGGWLGEAELERLLEQAEQINATVNAVYAAERRDASPAGVALSA